MTRPRRLTMTVASDGIWLHFKASNGNQVGINVEWVAEVLGPSGGKTILEWCDDRRKECTHPLAEFTPPQHLKKRRA